MIKMVAMSRRFPPDHRRLWFIYKEDRTGIYIAFFKGRKYLFDSKDLALDWVQKCSKSMISQKEDS